MGITKEDFERDLEGYFMGSSGGSLRDIEGYFMGSSGGSLRGTLMKTCIVLYCVFGSGQRWKF